MVGDLKIRQRYLQLELKQGVKRNQYEDQFLLFLFFLF